MFVPINFSQVLIMHTNGNVIIVQYCTFPSQLLGVYWWIRTCILDREVLGLILVWVALYIFFYNDVIISVLVVSSQSWARHKRLTLLPFSVSVSWFSCDQNGADPVRLLTPAPQLCSPRQG